MADVSLLFNVLVRDNTGPGLNSASTRMEKFRAATSMAATGIVAGLAAAGTAAVKAAADQSAAISAWTQVTGKSMDQQQQAIARSLNLSQTDYAKSYTTLSSLYQSNGLSQKKANEMAAKGLKLAADQAAFGNTTVGEAVEAQAGLLKGSGELLEKYAISITAADVAARMKADGTDKLKGAELKAATAQAKANLVMEQSAKFAGQASRESGSLESRQQKLAATIEDMKAKIGAKLLPTVEKMIGKFQELANWVEHNQTKAKAIAIAIGAVAGVVVTAAVAMKAYRAALMVARVATAAYTGVMWLLNAAFLANPIVGVIAVLVALGVALVVAYKKSETFRNIVNGAFAAVKKFFVGMWDTMRFAAGKGIKFIGGLYITFADGVLGVIEGLLRGASKLPRWLGGGKFDAAADAVAGIRSGLDALKRKLDEIPTERTLTFRSNANEVIGSIEALRRAQASVGTASGGATLSSGGGTQQGRYGGMRASGGPVSKGTTYLVGEKGPELFTASASGRIIPNHVIRSSGSGGRMGGGMRQYGRWTMDGFAEGMKDRQKVVDATMEKLSALVLKRIEKLKAAVARSKEIAAGIRDSFASFGNITSLETGGTFVTNLRAMTDKATAFAKGVTELRKKGLDKRALEQIIAAGPEGGLATVEQLLNQGGIGAVNDAMKKIAEAGAGLGRREAIAQTGYDPRTDARALVRVGRQRQTLDLTLSGDGDELTEAIVKALRKKVRKSGGNVQVVLGRG